MKREELEGKVSYIPETGMKMFSDKENMMDFLKSRKDEDRLIDTEARTTDAFQIDDTPIVIRTIGRDADIRFKALPEFVDDDKLCDYMAGNRFFMGFKDGHDRTTLPVAESVEQAMYQRAGCDCSYITVETATKSREPISMTDRSKLISDAYSKTKGHIHILVRNGLIWAINSAVHQHTPEYDLLEVLLKNEKLSISSSVFYNDYSFIQLGLDDEAMVKELAEILEESGMDVYTVSLGLQFFDGIRANSSSRIQPVAVLDGRAIPVGDSLVMEHRNDRGEKSASISRWKSLCDQIYSALTDATEKIKELANIKITNPGGTLRMSAFKEKFPIDATLSVAKCLDEMYPDGCTAMDVYYALFDIIDTYAESVASFSPVARLGYEEKAARFLHREIADVALSEEAFKDLCRS